MTAEPVPAPSADAAADRGSRYAWYVLAFLWLVYTLNFLDRMVVAILLEPIRHEFQVSDTALGLLSGLAFATLYAGLAFPLARLADRGSRVRLLAGVLVVWSGFTVLCGCVSRFPLLLLARMGVAVGEAGCVPVSQSLIADYFGRHRRATAMGIHSTAVSAGLLLAFGVGGLIAARDGWRTAFIAVGLPGPVLALGLLLTVREPLREAERPAANPASRLSLGATLRQLLRVHSFRHAVIASTLTSFVSYGTLNWVAALIERRFDLSVAEAGRGLGLVFGVGTALGATLGGLVADRLAGRDARWYGWLPAGASLLYVPAALSAFNADTSAAALAWLFVPSILGAVFLGPVYAITQTLSESRSRAVAAAILSVAFIVVGNGLGPLAVGAMSDLARPVFTDRSLSVALSVAACVMFWSAFHFIWSARTLRRDLALHGTNRSSQ